MSALALAGPITAGVPSSTSGLPSEQDPPVGGVTTWTWISAGPGVAVTSQTQPTTVDAAAITVTLTRGIDLGTVVRPDAFAASWSMTTPLGTVTGTSTGDAVLDGGVWRLRASAAFSGGSWNVDSGRGGFAADVTTGDAGSTDDAVAWTLDGIVTG